MNSQKTWAPLSPLELGFRLLDKGAARSPAVVWSRILLIRTLQLPWIRFVESKSKIGEGMWPSFFSPCLEDRAHGPCDFCLKLFLKALLQFAIVCSSNSSKPSRTIFCFTIGFVKGFLFSRNMLFACVVHIRRPLKTADLIALRQDLGFPII